VRASQEFGDEPTCHGGREQRFAGGDDLDGGQELGRSGALEEEAARTSP
jgi:hypothetical protein